MSENSAAENAATVREALEIAALAEQEAEIFNGYDQERRIAALAALLAQAEAAERKVKQLARRHDLYMDGAADSLNKMHARAEAAEAERDAAVREVEHIRAHLPAATNAKNQAIRERDDAVRAAEYVLDAKMSETHRANNAERTAEEAQEALRNSTDFLIATFGNHSLAANAIIEQSRAALTKEGTERYDCGGDCTGRCEHTPCVSRTWSS